MGRPRVKVHVVTPNRRGERRRDGGCRTEHLLNRLLNRSIVETVEVDGRIDGRSAKADR
jgi:hypothetical protein